MRIGINGFGRIGRNHLSCALKRGHEVVAVNDLVETATLAHLLKYDSMYGPLGHELGHDGSALFVDGRWIATYAERDRTLSTGRASTSSSNRPAKFVTERRPRDTRNGTPGKSSSRRRVLAGNVIRAGESVGGRYGP
jgi:hypothetical protein